jgi:predicted DNA-binding transcriptional regulator AlpA
MTVDDALDHVAAVISRGATAGPVHDEALQVIRENIGIPPDDIISTPEVRELAGILSRHTLIDWRERRAFPEPFKRVGGRVELYDRREVQAWLARRR